LVLVADSTPNFATTAEWLSARLRRFKSTRQKALAIGADRAALGYYLDGTKVPPDDWIERVATELDDDVEAALALALRSRRLLAAESAGVRTGQMGEASADYPVAEPSRSAGGDGDNIRETPMGRIARFANPRLRLAFYDALALAEGLTDEEAEALADDLEEVAREERSRHAHRSTDS
jgi:hypothetical protein